MALLNALLLDLFAALLIAILITFPVLALYSAARWWWRQWLR